MKEIVIKNQKLQELLPLCKEQQVRTVLATGNQIPRLITLAEKLKIDFNFELKVISRNGFIYLQLVKI